MKLGNFQLDLRGRDSANRRDETRGSRFGGPEKSPRLSFCSIYRRTRFFSKARANSGRFAEVLVPLDAARADHGRTKTLIQLPIVSITDSRSTVMSILKTASSTPRPPLLN